MDRRIIDPQVRLEGKWSLTVTFHGDLGALYPYCTDVVIFPDSPWTQFTTPEGQLCLTNRPVMMVAEK